MKRIWSAFLTTFVVLLAVVGAGADVALKPVGRNAVPLRTKTLDADVVIEAGRFASTRLDVTFQNLQNQRIEADFIYTVPQGAVVTDFAYYYGEERVVARIVEKERARAIYQHITTRMRDPALVEMIGKNTFRARIFPIMPNADLRVQMRYVQCLPTRGAVASYQLPLLSFGETPLDKIRVAVRLPGAATQSLQVQSNLGVPITRDGDGVRVGFEGTNFRPGKDVRVAIAPRDRKISTATPPGVSLVAARSGGSGGFFAVAIDGARPVARPSIQIGTGRGLAVSELEPLAVPGGYLLTGRFRGRGAASVIVRDGVTGKALPPARVTFTDQVNADAVASRLWASARIARLSEVKTNRAEVIALSTRWGLPSKFTSWLAIPEEERKRYHREKTEAEMTVLAGRLSKFIRAGRGKSNEAQAIRKEFAGLARAIGDNPEQALSQRIGYLFEAQIQEAAQVVAQDVINRRSTSRARASRARLDRLCHEIGHSPKNALRDALDDGINAAAIRYAPYVERNEESSTEARQARAELERLSNLVGEKPSARLVWSLYNPMQKIAQIVAEEIVKDAATSPREAEARAELERLSNVTQTTASSHLRQHLSRAIAAQSKKVAQAIADNAEETNVAKADRAEYERLCREAGQSPFDYLASHLQNAKEMQARQIAGEILAHRENSPQVQASRAEIARLTRAAPHTFYSSMDLVANALGGPMSTQAVKIAEDIATGNEGSADAQARRAELERISHASGGIKRMTQMVDGALGQYWYSLQSRYLTYVEDGREDSDDARQMRAGVRRVKERLPSQVGTEADWLAQVKSTAAMQAFTRMEEWARATYGKPAYFSIYGLDRIVPEYWKNRDVPMEQPKPLAVQEDLQQKATRLAVFAGEKPDFLREKVLMPWAANTVTRLRKKIADAKGNWPEQARLGKEFLQAVRDPSYGVWADYELRSYGKNTPEGRVAFARDRFAKIIANPDVDEVDALLQEKSNKFDQTDHRARLARRYDEDRRLRVRQGDPLLCVYVPGSCRSVIAILPGGEVKALLWRADLKRWECRFDVPTYAASGAYEVTVHITGADGTRSQKIFRYDVDTTAPEGRADIVAVGESWEITVRADTDAARVAALLPWGERRVLEAVPGEPGRFFVRVAVPVGADTSGAVPVYITDRAHNRNEITAQWSAVEGGNR